MAKETVLTRANKSSKCPHCGEQQLVPIVYGYPSDLTMQHWFEGVLELGGCMMTGDDPQLHCMACHHDVWRDRRTRQPDEWHSMIPGAHLLVDPGPGLTRIFRLLDETGQSDT